MLSILKRAFRDFSDDECPVRAAALAYYTVFALPPLLVLLLMLAGLLWDPQDVQRAMETQFASLLGREGAATIHGMIQSADRPGSGGLFATVLSLGMLLFGATGAFLQLQSALNRAWEVKPDPDQGGVKLFLTKRLLSVGMILGVAFLMLVSLALSALISALGDTLTFIPAPVLYVVNFAVSFGVMTLLFAAIFRILPDATIEWRDVWVGALVTSLLFVGGKFVLGLYLGRSSPGDAFGAASALAVILVWVYYAGMIVLFGAEFTQSWAKHRGAEIRPEEGAIRIEREARVRAEKRGHDTAPPSGSADSAATSAPVPTTSRRMHMDNAGRVRPYRANGGNGHPHPVPRLAEDQSVGDLFRRFTNDSSLLIRQELTLAKLEIKETGSRVGQAAARLGVAVGVAIPGLLAVTAFLVIGLGDLIDNYWLSALIVGVAMLAVAGVLAKKAMKTFSDGSLGIPQTAGTLREDAEWAKEEVQAFKREFTADARRS